MCSCTMRAAAGLLLLLLGLCGSGAQGEGGGLGEVGEIREFQKRAPRDAAEESTEQTTKPIYDIWDELRVLRDMVVELNVLVELLQRENSAQATELTSLHTRLSATESKTGDLERQNADLQSRLSSSESELLISKSRIDQLERENAVQETRLTATESKTRELEKENAELQSRLSSCESELFIIKSRIDQLEGENAESAKVAFYTALTDNGNLGPYNTDITLKFSKVLTNVGNAYNPSTGLFIAPVKGVYCFHVSVFGFHIGEIGVMLYRNGQRIIFNAETNREVTQEFFTKVAVLELNAGDQIRLVLPTSYMIYDNTGNQSTFSGFLLFPL